jgi:hypothetical protein
MSNAKKAAAKSASIVDDEQAMVDKIASDIQPSGGVATTDLGMTQVADRNAPQQEGEDVRMVNSAGDEMDVAAADVKMHERSGWKRVKEEEV